MELRTTQVEPHGAKFGFTVLDNSKRPAMTIIFDTNELATMARDLFKHMVSDRAEFLFPAKE